MMSVKKMIELYVNYGLDQDTWEMLYEMRCHDLISYDNWMKFADTCKGWEFNPDDNGLTIIDTDKDNKVVYKQDENGFYVKA